jgi:RimJ/RimL family protein N-acetyltransferase
MQFSHLSKKWYNDHMMLEVIKVSSQQIWLSELLRFRKTNQSDVEYVIKAEQDPENQPYIIPWSYNQHIAALSNPNCMHFIIEDIRQKSVGFTILFGLQNQNGSIELMRIVITEKGKGYGQLAIKMIQDLVFQRLKAHRLWLDVKEQNARARSIYENLGFRYEGKLRECIKSNGRYESLILMSMLESEYAALLRN